MNQRTNFATPALEVRQFKAYTQRQLDQIPQLQQLSDETRFNMQVVSQVLPFRVNNYVVEELIDWNNVPDDPIFQLTFPQKEMLNNEDFNRIASLLRSQAPAAELKNAITEIRQSLNPHPAGQMDMNLPMLDGQPLAGMQHKYRETVLFFPSQGQVCHSYCTFCFRWAQFVGDKNLRFASHEVDNLHAYLAKHTEVTDLLITGGDPMVMKASHLRAYLEKLLQPEFDHLRNIRIGSKSLSFWPQRFVTDPDAQEILQLFKQLTKAGKHLAFMAHFNHWQEMQTPICQEAIKRIQATGAIIRTQSPLVRHINDKATDWIKMWTQQVRLGLVPYYMFIERDTGSKNYFELPLAEAYTIYNTAIKKVPGLARTARGPSMSADPGKVEIQGITELNGEKVFVLRLIQARNPDWVGKPFFAKYDSQATWFDQLQPAFGASEFFFSAELATMEQHKQQLIAKSAS